jgi:two-component system LytT family response regulator
MNTIVIEDEPKSNKVLCKLLTEFCDDVSVVGSAFDVSEARALIKNTNPDLVFLDIELPGGNGFDLLELMQDKKAKVVFTTSYKEYAIKAIKSQAFDYLLKPINIDELTHTVAKAKKALENEGPEINEQLISSIKSIKNANRVVIPTLDGLTIIDADSIIYCQADNNYTIFYLNDGHRIVSSKTLKECERILSFMPFSRIHQSYLVNLKHVKKYINGKGGTVQMQTGVSLEVSVRKKEVFMDSLSRFCQVF